MLRLLIPLLISPVASQSYIGSITDATGKQYYVSRVIAKNNYELLKYNISPEKDYSVISEGKNGYTVFSTKKTTDILSVDSMGLIVHGKVVVDEALIKAEPKEAPAKFTEAEKDNLVNRSSQLSVQNSIFDLDNSSSRSLTVSAVENFEVTKRVKTSLGVFANIYGGSIFNYGADANVGLLLNNGPMAFTVSLGASSLTSVTSINGFQDLVYSHVSLLSETRSSAGLIKVYGKIAPLGRIGSFNLSEREYSAGLRFYPKRFTSGAAQFGIGVSFSDMRVTVNGSPHKLKTSSVGIFLDW